MFSITGYESVRLTGAGGQGFTVKCTTLKPSREHKMKTALGRRHHQHLCWLNDQVALTYTDGLLHVFRLEEDDADVDPVQLPVQSGTVTAISPHPDGQEAFLQLSSGSVVKFSLKDMAISSHFQSHLPKTCVKMEVACHDGDTALIRLSAKNRLYVNQTEVLNGASSFFVHSDFLLVTTIQHELKSLPLAAVFQAGFI